MQVTYGKEEELDARNLIFCCYQVCLKGGHGHLSDEYTNKYVTPSSQTFKVMVQYTLLKSAVCTCTVREFLTVLLS